jgi:hypothetical protein
MARLIISYAQDFPLRVCRDLYYLPFLSVVFFLKNVRKQVLPFYAECSCTLYYYSTVDVLSCDIK